jgi:hypothetical protein
MSSCGRSELRIFAALTSENSDKAKLTHKAHSPSPIGYPSGAIVRSVGIIGFLRTSGFVPSTFYIRRSAA